MFKKFQQFWGPSWNRCKSMECHNKTIKFLFAIYWSVSFPVDGRQFGLPHTIHRNILHKQEQQKILETSLQKFMTMQFYGFQNWGWKFLLLQYGNLIRNLFQNINIYTRVWVFMYSLVIGYEKYRPELYWKYSKKSRLRLSLVKLSTFKVTTC